MNKLLNIDLLLHAYSTGFFPMAESREGDIYWHSPDMRAIIPFERIKEPRSCKQTIKKQGFTFTLDKAFQDVITTCSQIIRDYESGTWISKTIIDTYIKMHKLKYAHSVETWQDGQLVGGLYGVTIGGAFFGESMFSKISGASKAAFYRLVEHLKSKGYVLIDSQYLNHHTELLGAIEVPKNTYLDLLQIAILHSCSFD